MNRDTYHRAIRFINILGVFVSIIGLGAGLALIGPWAMIAAGSVGLIVTAWLASK